MPHTFCTLELASACLQSKPLPRFPLTSVSSWPTGSYWRRNRFLQAVLPSQTRLHQTRVGANRTELPSYYPTWSAHRSSAASSSAWTSHRSFSTLSPSTLPSNLNNWSAPTCTVDSTFLVSRDWSISLVASLRIGNLQLGLLTFCRRRGRLVQVLSALRRPFSWRKSSPAFWLSN